MYTDTITVFNRSGSDATGFVWFPTVISGVDLIIDKSANMQKTGIETADTAKLHVKYENAAGAIVIDGKTYLPPKEWAAQSDEIKSTTLTFNEGVDFFVLGDYPEEAVKDVAYVTRNTNGFFDALNRERDYLFKITNVGGPYKLIPHFEIGGT